MNPNFPNPNRATRWQLISKTLHFPENESPAIMGIVNVTPDSFSDGGKFFDHSVAVEHALKLADEGATILDIGGESTRPYSAEVSESEELRRVVAVVKGVCEQTDVPVSIDTSKAAVARAAIEAGAEIVNDVTGLEKDQEMLGVVSKTGAAVCAMHMQGTPQTMQDNPLYQNLIEEIYDYLRQRQNWLLDNGIQSEKICLDPGIGFGKSYEHNMQLLKKSEHFLDLKSPILIGHSRKGFISKLLTDKAADRTAATLGIGIQLAQKGIQILRVHDVKQARDAIKGFMALESE